MRSRLERIWERCGKIQKLKDCAEKLDLILLMECCEADSLLSATSLYFDSNGPSPRLNLAKKKNSFEYAGQILLLTSMSESDKPPEYFLKTQGYFADTYSRGLVGYKLHVQWPPKIWERENVLRQIKTSESVLHFSNKIKLHFITNYSYNNIQYNLMVMLFSMIWEWDKENELILQQKKFRPFAQNNSHDQWHKYDLEMQNQKYFLFICCK